MPLFINRRRLNAAVNSFHQLMPSVRAIFPTWSGDDIVESATAYLYHCMAIRVFGSRFAEAMRLRLRAKYRSAPSVDIERRAARIAEKVAVAEREGCAGESTRTQSQQHVEHVTGAIRAMFAEADIDDAPARLSAAFPKFEDALECLQKHLEGIKRQNIWVMRGS